MAFRLLLQSSHIPSKITATAASVAPTPIPTAAPVGRVSLSPLPVDCACCSPLLPESVPVVLELVRRLLDVASVVPAAGAVLAARGSDSVGVDRVAATPVVIVVVGRGSDTPISDNCEAIAMAIDSRVTLHRKPRNSSGVPRSRFLSWPPLVLVCR